MKTEHFGFFLLVALVVGFIIGRKTHKNAALPDFLPENDTIIVRDTITREKPVYVDRYLTRIEQVFLPVHDTTVVRDSVLVDIPIETRVYAEDSVYRAVVSGWKPSLDTLLVYNTTREVTKFVPVRDTRRWGVGLTAGYGVGKGGLTPYVGVGITYNLIKF
jgi:hypothetical protein